VSRWPVTGPSGYWLLDSSPASKVKQQYTHGITNIQKMMTIHTRQIQLTKIHIRKTTSRGESTVYYGMHDNFLCDAKFSQFETYICPCERYESEWGSGYVPQFIFTFTPRWKWVVGFRPDRFGSEKRDMATAEQKPEWVSQSFRTFCRRQKIVTTAGSRTWSLAFVVSVVCGFCSFSHFGKLSNIIDIERVYFCWVGLGKISTSESALNVFGLFQS